MQERAISDTAAYERRANRDAINKARPLGSNDHSFTLDKRLGFPHLDACMYVRLQCRRWHSIGGGDRGYPAEAVTGPCEHEHKRVRFLIRVVQGGPVLPTHSTMPQEDTGEVLEQTENTEMLVGLGWRDEE